MAPSRVGLALLSLLALPVLTACGPEIDGGAGIGVDAQGRLIGYVQTCDKALVNFSVFDVTRSSDSELIHPGYWRSPEPFEGFISFPLVDPPDGWTIERPMTTLDPGITYSFGAGSKNHTVSTDDVEFTTEELGNLRPGDVLHSVNALDSEGNLTTTVSSVEEFRAEACPT